MGRAAGENRENQPALRRCRVEGLSQAAKPDAPHPQIFNGFDHLLHRARQPVELPHNQRVAAAREFEGVVQRRSVIAPDMGLVKIAREGKW